MWRRLVTAVSVCLVAGVLAPVAAPLVAAVEPSPATIFHGVTPARLLETRTGVDKLTVDHEFEGDGAFGSGTYLDLQVAGRAGSNVPGSAGAVVLNVTAISPSATGFITIYPQGGTQPNASSLNTAAGRTLPNMVIVPVGDYQGITIFNSNGTTHMAIDVLGWFPDSTTAFGGVDPARLMETRTGPGKETIDHLSEGIGARTANSTTDLEITTRGNVPVNAGAVALNVTAINPSANSFLTIYPKGATRPNASNLNLAAGRTVPNMVIVPIGTDGSITIYNAAGTTHLAVDVLGWFPDATTAFGGSVPQRMLETRVGADKLTVDHSSEGIGARGPNSTTTLPIGGRGLVPAGAGAVALNVTAISPTANSFITIYPTGQARPNASNLNLAAGRTLPNMVIVPLGDDGSIEIYNAAGTTHLAVDVLGWFPTAATTTRVHLTNSSAQANGGASTVELTADGLFIGFVSVATNLVATDTNAHSDAFVRDLTTGTNELVSKSTAGVQGNADSYLCDLSDNARYALFVSTASNLVASDVGGFYDLFVRDRQTNTTTLISKSTAGVQGNGDAGCGEISADGRYVAFHTGASNLATDTNGSTGDVFVRDTVNNTTTLISKSTGGVQGNGGSAFPDISADGTTVVYESTATNLVAADTNAAQDIFVYVIATGVTGRVSVQNNGSQVTGMSEMGRLSGDGSIATFISYATDVVPGKTSTRGDIIMRDTVNSTTTRVSVSSAFGESNASSYYHDISDDGNTIVFESYATNLTTPNTGGNSDIFVRDVSTGDTSQVNVATNGTPSDAFSFHARVSNDGLRIAYLSDSSVLVDNDTNSARDIFLYDRT